MAVIFSYCDGFHLLFVIILGICGVFSVDESHYYRIHSSAQHAEVYPEFRLLEDKLMGRQKRNVVPQPFLTSVLSTNVTPALNVSEVTTTPFAKPKIVKKVETNIEVTPNSTTVLEKKNLGENGHGIRRNITKTTVIPPLIHNVLQGLPNQEVLLDTTTKYPDTLDEDDMNEDRFNQSLKSHNITQSRTERNKYYNSSIITDPQVGKKYWVNMSSRADVKISQMLSKSHRRASTVKLSFDFPFYGHLIEKVTIATGGFLYTGEYVHSWLAATQYIAPLMANFDTSISNDSFIRYLDDGNKFTVEWEKVSLQDRPKDGSFTFQVTLLKNGDIIFVYASIPVLIDQIKEHHHPVKVGLSDAYIMDQTIFLARRKTIYEYERVHFNKTEIGNWTSIYLQALPTCLENHDCYSCVTQTGPFTCRWCPTFKKCSEGFDRNRQEWVEQGCEKKSFLNVSLCSMANETILDRDTIYQNELSVNEDDDTILAGQVMYQQQKVNANVSGILAIVFLIGMATGFSFWVFYAYRNPHTTSGQILIRYRPSQWRWRRGEARYTAATIHM